MDYTRISTIAIPGAYNNKGLRRPEAQIPIKFIDNNLVDYPLNYRVTRLLVKDVDVVHIGI